MPITIERAVSCALWHANREIQTPDRDLAQRQHHRDQLCNLIEGSAYPQLVLHEVTRRLGRARAMMVDIDPNVIRTATRTPKLFEGRL